MTQFNYGPISARRVMLGYSKSWQNACKICVFSVERIKIIGSLYVMQWCLAHRYQHLGGTWHFHLQGWKERTHEPWRGVWQVPPNCLSLSTKPHGVISRDFILNKPKSPLQITCLGLMYMSTRVVELNCVSNSSQDMQYVSHFTKQMVMSPLWNCPELCVRVSH